MMTEVSSWILFQYLWWNASIKVDKTPIQFSLFSEKYICYTSQLFSENSSIKEWHEFKRQYGLHVNSFFQWM